MSLVALLEPAFRIGWRRYIRRPHANPSNSDAQVRQMAPSSYLDRDVLSLRSLCCDKSIIQPMSLTNLTENEFIERFRPEYDQEPGCYYRQRDWTDLRDKFDIEMARREGRLWTQIDADDGTWCIVSGCHHVNRNYYVICEVPTPDGEDFEVVDDYIPEDEDEEDWDDASED